jgi:hypothetical protein
MDQTGKRKANFRAYQTIATCQPELGIDTFSALEAEVDRSRNA